MYVHVRIALAVGLIGVVLASCTQAPDEREGAAASPIIGGEADASDPAVVMLAAWPPDESTLSLCTATLIAPDVLLTAAHCVDPVAHPNAEFGVFLGPDANAYPTLVALEPQLVPISEFHVHPDYDDEAPFTADLAVVILAEPLSTAVIPVSRVAPATDQLGDPARIVGYGQTEYEQPNAKKYVADTILAGIDAGDTITVGDSLHRTCLGDSGGPALMTIDGVEMVVGVNSYTDLSGCLDAAHYRRTDLYTAFLDQYAPPPASEGGGGAGGASLGAGGGGGDEGDADADDGCALRSAPRGAMQSLLLIGACIGVAVTRRAARRRSSAGR